MIRYKRTVTILLSSVLIGIIIMSIAYAAMQSTLNVTFSKITQQALTWDIGFKIETVAGVPNRTGVNCGTVTVTNSQISGFSPEFQAIGDMCSYTFHIVNNGNIAGKISSINISKPLSSCTVSGSSMTCKNIEYNLRYNTSTSTTYVSVGDVIAAKSGSTATENTVVLTIAYSSASAPTTFTGQSFSYTITYDQY